MMKKIKIVFSLFVSLLGMLFFVNTTYASVNTDLQNNLNNFAQNDESADFTKAVVKGKTITVTVDDSYVEDPVEELGRESFMSDVFSQVKKIQKGHGTKYTLIIKDKKSGKLAKANYKGNGWVRNSNDHTEKNEYDFN